MSQPTHDRLSLRAHATAEPAVRLAASVVFNLSGYTVHDAVDRPLGGRRVVVASDATEEACPGCGVFSSRVHPDLAHCSVIRSFLAPSSA